MSHLISIIVPIYNVEKYLEKCIESILNQTYRNLQIILVDDGSEDSSLDICRRYEVIDSRITVIHKQNEGLVCARKTGIQAAVGEFIGYVDSDDWIEPGMYEMLYENMIQYNVDLVETAHFCDIEDISQKIDVKIKPGFYLQHEILPIMLCDEDFDECRIAPYVWSKLFKREILLDVQMQVDDRISLGEDAAVTYPYIVKSKKIYISDCAGYHYIQRKGSISSQKNASDRLSNDMLVGHLQNFFEKDLNAHVLLKQLNGYAKLLLLLRQIADCDNGEMNEILMPFGGLKQGDRVVIYGAGSLGKSVYEYLYHRDGIEIVAWLDRAYKMHQKLDCQVIEPQKIEYLKGKYDYILIAIYSKRTADSVERYLMDMGIKQEQIRWLTDQFINRNYIADIL